MCVHNLVHCAPSLFYQDALTVPLSGEGGIKTQILMGEIFIQHFVEKQFNVNLFVKFLEGTSYIYVHEFFSPPSLVSDPLEGSS